MCCAARRAPSSLHVAVVDVASDLLRDRFCDLLGWGVVVVHAAPGAVAFQAMADVKVLLEVVAQREVDEGPLVRGQLHRRREASLHNGEVAGGEVAVEVVHVGDHLQAVDQRPPTQRIGVDAGAGDDDHAQLWDSLLCLWEGRDHPSQQIHANA